ncbi:MAG TPA: LLM class F420-dependent oxidoreductase [Candidatus Binatia bacterium]|nr:LLM class F420-dependent oxidoreductase [Candidatus Binatia bacterium]
MTKFGVFLPVSGRAASRKTLMQAAQEAEALGYDSVWAADRLVIPWKIDTTYPYSKEATFIVPPDRPFFDTMTCLAFLAGCTEKIQLGMSVMVLPYRHPLHWSRIATTIDQLSNGRLILGVGVGWMEEEFAAMNAPFKERGKVSDEQLTLLKQLWSEEHITFHGKYYNVDDIAFLPKSYQKPRLPIWVGGEGKYAQRRAGRFGDAWFPYFVKVTPEQLAAGYDNVRAEAKKAGRDADDVKLACCLPVELTANDGPPITDYLKGSIRQVTERLKQFIAVGCIHIGLQFMIPHYPERREQIERFAKEALAELKAS